VASSQRRRGVLIDERLKQRQAVPARILPPVARQLVSVSEWHADLGLAPSADGEGHEVDRSRLHRRVFARLQPVTENPDLRLTTLGQDLVDPRQLAGAFAAVFVDRYEGFRHVGGMPQAMTLADVEGSARIGLDEHVDVGLQFVRHLLDYGPVDRHEPSVTILHSALRDHSSFAEHDTSEVPGHYAEARPTMATATRSCWRDADVP